MREEHEAAARRVRAGEIGFAEFVHATEKLWDRWAQQIGGTNPADVEDARQELLAEAWVALGTARTEGFIWFQARRRALRRTLRKRARVSRELAFGDGFDLEAFGGGQCVVEERVDAARCFAAIWESCETDLEQRAFQVYLEESGFPAPIPRRRPGRKVNNPPAPKYAGKVVRRLARSLHIEGGI